MAQETQHEERGAQEGAEARMGGAEAEFTFGCHVPGHFEAGVRGVFVVEAA